MKIINTSQESVELALNRDEVLILHNALNELCNGPSALDEEEFHSRTGVEKQFAIATLDELGRVDLS